MLIRSAVPYSMVDRTAVYMGINKKERILVLNELTANMAVFFHKYVFLFAVSFIHIPPIIILNALRR